jgi:putative membrane protein
VAALVIAVVGTVVLWLLSVLGLPVGSGVYGLLITIVVAAVILMVSDRFVKGMKVNGFMGAVIAAISIGVVGYLVTWLLGMLGIGV